MQNTTLNKPKTLTPASTKTFLRCPQMRNKTRKENKSEGTRTRGSNPGGRTKLLAPFLKQDLRWVLFGRLGWS